MINLNKVKSYCKDFQKIENFLEAYNDLDETWHCHHRLEINTDYENTMEDLIMMNLYYDRPPEELIFLRADEHISLHHKGKKPSNWSNLIITNRGKKRSDESRKKMSERAKNRINNGGHKFKGMKWKVVNGRRVWYVP